MRHNGEEIMKDKRTPAQKNGHAIAIINRATLDAEKPWGYGWRLLTVEQRRACICLNLVELLNQPVVQKSATPQTIIDVLALARVAV